MKALGIIVLLASIILAGCASAPTMERDEFLSATSRTYEGVTEKEFFAAAKRLFELSDPDDMGFSYPSMDSMVATHYWSFTLVLSSTEGRDIWTIKTISKDGDISANITLNQERRGAGSIPGGLAGNQSFLQAASWPGDSSASPAVYELFWARMDYLLGKATHWPTCENFQGKINSGETYGDVGALCSWVVDDNAPVQASLH